MVDIIQYQLQHDANRSLFGGAIAPPQHNNAYVLSGGVAQAISIPTGARFALFSCTGSFFAQFSGVAAAVPAANITNGSAPELNPVARYVEGYTAFSVIAPGDCILTISYLD